MNITIEYNTSPTATAVEFGIRPRRRADRIRMMRAKAEQLADWLQRENDDTVTLVRVEVDDDHSNPFAFSTLTPRRESLIRQFMASSPPLVGETNATIRMMDDESIVTVARLAPLMITNPDVAVAVAWEILSVAHELVPQMLHFSEYVHVVDPAGPFEPETRGIHHRDEDGTADRTAMWGHVVALPLDAHTPYAVSNCLDASAIAHEAAHVMADVLHLRMLGHDRRWVHAYSELLHELDHRGTVDAITEIVAGHHCRSSVTARVLPPIPIRARSYLGETDRSASHGVPPLAVLRVLVTSFPQQMPRQKIIYPHVGVGTVD